MSLDVYLMQDDQCVFEKNITHNLNSMAEAAGVYMHLWQPAEIDIQKAWQLIEPLGKGLSELMNNPVRFKAFNAENGWGKYEHLVDFVLKYLQACKEFPDAIVKANR